jgi:hypothetical protein
MRNFKQVLTEVSRMQTRFGSAAVLDAFVLGGSTKTPPAGPKGAKQFCMHYHFVLVEFNK